MGTKKPPGEDHTCPGANEIKGFQQLLFVIFASQAFVFPKKVAATFADGAFFFKQQGKRFVAQLFVDSAEKKACKTGPFHHS
jgi:hypothetical protein